MAEHMEINLREAQDKILVFSTLNSATRDELLEKKNIIFQGEYTNLKNLLVPSRYIDLDDIIDSDLLSKLINDEKITIGMAVKPLNEDVKRYYIKRSFSRNDEIISEDEMCKLNDDDRDIITIWNSPGSGKSTVLDTLAVALKKNHPHLWVVKIDLNDYSKALLTFKQNKLKPVTVIDLLNSKPESQIVIDLEKKIFSIPDKVVFMIDGIDEARSGYKDIISNIISDCKRNRCFARVFVTSSAIGEQIENPLPWYNTLLDFSKNNQIEFLKKYWEQKFDLQRNKKCEIYADKLITAKWIDEGNGSPVGVPIQIQMLAELLETKENFDDELLTEWEGCYEFLSSSNSEPVLPTKINLVQLYRLFVHKNCCKYKGKQNYVISNIRYIHQCHLHLYIIALENILNKEQCEYFSCYKNRLERIPKEQLHTFSILKKIDNKFRFTHRSYSEYFLAECILAKLHETLSKQFITFLIEEVLATKRYRFVRTLLDEFIQSDWILLPNKTLLDLGHSLNETDNTVLQTLVKEGFMGMLKFVFKCFELSEIPLDLESVRVDGRTMLQIALMGGRLNIAKFLIEKNAPVENRDDNEYSALHIAAQKHPLSTIKFLVQHGAEVHCKDAGGRTPLHEACAYNSLDTVQYLLEHGPLVDSRDSQGRTPLHEAAKTGDLDKVKYLIEKGADVNARARLDSPLIEAVKKRHLSVVKYLVAKGADVTFRYRGGGSVLHNNHSFGCGNVEDESVNLYKFLMETGVDVNVVDQGGNTVLHSIISEDNRTELVEFLVLNGADINRVNKRGYTALDTALTYKAFNTVKYLAEKGVQSVNPKDVLFRAVTDGYLNVMKYLAENGANLGVLDKYGRSTLHQAVSCNNIDVIKFLVDEGVDVNSKTEEGTTVLDEAFKRCDTDVIKFLVERGAQTETALVKAASKGDLNLIEFLVQRGEWVDKIEDVKDFEVLRFLMERGVDVDKSLKLYEYAETGDLSAMEYLLGKGADVNYACEIQENRTALHKAVANDCFHVVKFLVKHGARVDVKDDVGRTALYETVLNNSSMEIVEFLVAKGGNVNSETNEKRTPLLEAIEYNRLAYVKFLVEHGAEFRLKPELENSILATPLINGYFDIVEYLFKKNDFNDTIVDLIERRIRANKKPESDNLLVEIFARLDTVKSLLQRGMQLGIKEIEHYNLLQNAASRGDLKFVKYLIGKGADVNSRDKEGNAALHQALDSPGIIKFLVEKGADVNVRDRNGYMALHNADLSLTKFLVQKGANVNAKTDKNWTVLHEAVQSKSSDVCKFLIKNDAKVDTPDLYGRTVLDIAGTIGSFSKLKYLLEQGAKLGEPQGNSTLLLDAYMLGDYDVVKLLVENGAQIGRKTSDGYTVLHKAVEISDIDSVKYLLSNAKDEDVTMIFQHAVAESELDIVKYLVKNGAKVNAKDEAGYPMLHEAASSGDFEMVKFLLEIGADVAAVDGNGCTALHEAAKSGELYTVKILIDYGADVNAKDRDSSPVLHYASKSLNIVNILVQNGAKVED